jgi:hypothetical protein
MKPESIDRDKPGSAHKHTTMYGEAHKGEVLLENIQQSGTDERRPREHPRSIRRNAKKANPHFPEGKGQEHSPTTENLEWN